MKTTDTIEPTNQEKVPAPAFVPPPPAPPLPTEGFGAKKKAVPVPPPLPGAQQARAAKMQNPTTADIVNAKAHLKTGSAPLSTDEQPKKQTERERFLEEIRTKGAKFLVDSKTAAGVSDSSAEAENLNAVQLVEKQVNTACAVLNKFIGQAKSYTLPEFDKKLGELRDQIPQQIAKLHMTKSQAHATDKATIGSQIVKLQLKWNEAQAQQNLFNNSGKSAVLEGIKAYGRSKGLTEEQEVQELNPVSANKDWESVGISLKDRKAAIDKSTELAQEKPATLKVDGVGTSELKARAQAVQAVIGGETTIKEEHSEEQASNVETKQALDAAISELADMEKEFPQAKVNAAEKVKREEVINALSAMENELKPASKADITASIGPITKPTVDTKKAFVAAGKQMVERLKEFKTIVSDAQETAKAELAKLQQVVRDTNQAKNTTGSVMTVFQKQQLSGTRAAQPSVMSTWMNFGKVFLTVKTDILHPNMWRNIFTHVSIDRIFNVSRKTSKIIQQPRLSGPASQPNNAARKANYTAGCAEVLNAAKELGNKKLPALKNEINILKDVTVLEMKLKDFKRYSAYLNTLLSAASDSNNTDWQENGTVKFWRFPGNRYFVIGRLLNVSERERESYLMQYELPYVKADKGSYQNILRNVKSVISAIEERIQTLNPSQETEIYNCAVRR